MRHLALLATVAVLGSGCIVHGNDCPPTLTVEWRTFTSGDGAELDCAQAGLAFVDIFIDGQAVARWNCTDYGATITGVQRRVQTLTVEGVEASGRIAFRDEFGVDASACGDHVVRAHPAEGFLDVNYAFQNNGPCAGNPSYLWFSIFDQVVDAVTAEVSEKTPGFEAQYVCGVYATPGNVPPNALFLPLPAGPHRLQWIEERVFTGGLYRVAAAACAPLDFTVQGGVVNTIPSPTVPLVLADTTVACPHP